MNTDANDRSGPLLARRGGGWRFGEGGGWSLVVLLGWYRVRGYNKNTLTPGKWAAVKRGVLYIERCRRDVRRGSRCTVATAEPPSRRLCKINTHRPATATVVIADTVLGVCRLDAAAANPKARNDRKIVFENQIRQRRIVRIF